MLDLMVKAKGIVICGGDWNLRLNPELDTSKKVPTTSLHKKVNNLMVELGILDLWRDFNPLRRDYTFYSFPHNTYSRIDYFFVFKRDRSKISYCNIGTADLSDHASVSCGVQISDNPRKTLWRLNTSALNNPQFVAQIRKEIKQFLDENDNGKVDAVIVWDALKAVIRGKVISWCAHNKKKKQLRITDLSKELKNLEEQHKRAPTSNLLTKIKKIRNEIDLLYTQEIEKNMIFAKQKYYEAGPRSAKILARRLQKQRADNTIYKIKHPASNILQYKQEELQNSFEKYYTTLYSQPQLENEQQIEAFLKSLNLPTVSEEHNTIMTAAITETELSGAISRLKTNKSPGPDGFPSDWYKAFRTELLPIAFLEPAVLFLKIQRCRPPGGKQSSLLFLKRERIFQTVDRTDPSRC